ncbi:MAG: VRR-NUC domain-containing protein [Synergistaceae bacterium]|nr:VRR-NUC domain-containing protein [Synergistaceae bacterium]
MLEKAIERRLINAVKKLGGLCYKFTSPGTVGVPDRIIITAQGKVIFAELKTETGKLSKIQEYVINQMRLRGADVRVLYGTAQVDELVKELSNGI